MKNTNSIGMLMLIELKVLIAFVRKDIIIILILALHDPTRDVFLLVSFSISFFSIFKFCISLLLHWLDLVQYMPFIVIVYCKVSIISFSVSVLLIYTKPTQDTFVLAIFSFYYFKNDTNQTSHFLLKSEAKRS